MTYGVQKLYSESTADKSCRWTYSGIVLSKGTKNILVTSALLGQQSTHFFYWKNDLDRRRTILTPIPSNNDLLLFLEITGINRNDYYSVSDGIAHFANYGIRTAVSCVGATGQIDQMGCWVDVTNETNSVLIDGSDLIRIKLDKEPAHCLAGAPVVLRYGRPSAIGIVVAQSGFHLYAQHANLLEAFGSIKGRNRINRQTPETDSVIRKIEAELSKIKQEAEALP